MEPQLDSQRLEPRNALTPQKACVHGRLIDTILTECGTPTGKVRCVECGAVIEDPHHSQR